MYLARVHNWERFFFLPGPFWLTAIAVVYLPNMACNYPQQQSFFGIIFWGPCYHIQHKQNHESENTQIFKEEKKCDLLREETVSFFAWAYIFSSEWKSHSWNCSIMKAFWHFQFVPIRSVASLGAHINFLTSSSSHSNFEINDLKIYCACPKFLGPYSIFIDWVFFLSICPSSGGKMVLHVLCFNLDWFF